MRENFKVIARNTHISDEQAPDVSAKNIYANKPLILKKYIVNLKF